VRDEKNVRIAGLFEVVTQERAQFVPDHGIPSRTAAMIAERLVEGFEGVHNAWDAG
jgi:hypothetical protein